MVSVLVAATVVPRGLVPLFLNVEPTIAGSSNGKTVDSDSTNAGSIPAPVATPFPLV